jgi:hypothetical protein
MKTYRIHFERLDYGFVDVQAENEQKAQDRYTESDDETLTKTIQDVLEIEVISDDNERDSA